MDLGCGCRVLGGVFDVRLGDEVASARRQSVPGVRTAACGASLKGGQAVPARNWALFLIVVLCVEFWVIVTTSVANHI